jgi:hypothetical protein
MRENLGNQQITFIEQYGSETEGNMLGTESFPELHVNKDGYFPMQNDGCNCGVGVCATIGIMFRDFLPRNEDFLLDDLFSRANMPMHRCESSGEFFCYMPVTLMKKVPFHDNTTRGRKEREKDYLRLLREQWFMLFDQMAEFQFVGGPWMLDKNNKSNVAYASTLDVLAWPPG